MLDALAQTLAAELAASGFTPEPLSVKLVGARIADRGKCECERLSHTLVPGPWRALCARHLGIGASFTEFLVGGLALECEFKSQIASLGGIAHTIYALFDALLDVSQSPPALFGSNPLFAADPEIRGKQELVVALVNLYFEKLRLLSSGAPRVHVLLERAIQKLHNAELQSAMRGKIERKTWWRKNALPIVVMGLPAWLSKPQKGKIRFTEHLMWLGQVGEFLGWLDDFSDYERDCAAGQANRLRFLDGISIEGHARRATAMARRILRSWDSRNGSSPARDTFTVIAWTWLTAPESKPAQNQLANASASGSAH